jgi:hypothetical protein
MRDNSSCIYTTQGQRTNVPEGGLSRNEVWHVSLIDTLIVDHVRNFRRCFCHESSIKCSHIIHDFNAVGTILNVSRVIIAPVARLSNFTHPDRLPVGRNTIPWPIRDFMSLVLYGSV